MESNQKYIVQGILHDGRFMDCSQPLSLEAAELRRVDLHQNGMMPAEIRTIDKTTRIVTVENANCVYRS